jgi:hypothetical protein
MDADEAAIPARRVEDGNMRGEEIAVIVLLIGGRHMILALGKLLEPVVLVLLAQIEPLHIVGRDELALVRRSGDLAVSSTKWGTPSRSTIVQR